MADPPTVMSGRPLPWLWIGMAAVVIPLLLVLASGLRRDPRALPSPLVGRIAPPFDLQMFTGGRLTSAELRGRLVILNFWASWCVPACTDEAPSLQAIWEQYRTKGVTVVGVNIQDREAPARAFIQHFGQTFPTGMDPQGLISIDYGVYGVPETFVIDQQGRTVYKYAGAVSEDLLAPVIVPLLDVR
jgi:cytochrome c biogenesis protein CcmG, thiol:disulfide interchange protein DsbE